MQFCPSAFLFDRTSEEYWSGREWDWCAIANHKSETDEKQTPRRNTHAKSEKAFEYGTCISYKALVATVRCRGNCWLVNSIGQFEAGKFIRRSNS
jgi:hypothetical protein